MGGTVKVLPDAAGLRRFNHLEDLAHVAENCSSIFRGGPKYTITINSISDDEEEPPMYCTILYCTTTDCTFNLFPVSTCIWGALEVKTMRTIVAHRPQAHTMTSPFLCLAETYVSTSASIIKPPCHWYPWEIYSTYSDTMIQTTCVLYFVLSVQTVEPTTPQVPSRGSSQPARTRIR